VPLTGGLGINSSLVPRIKLEELELLNEPIKQLIVIRKINAVKI